MKKGVVLPVIILTIASLRCQAYVITTGSLQETASPGGLGFDLTFNLSGPDFSLSGQGRTSAPPCTLLPCEAGTTQALDDSISSEDRGFRGVLAISGVSYPFATGPGAPFDLSMDFRYVLSFPSTPASVTLTAPFTITGVTGGQTCFPPDPSCFVPFTSFSGMGTATLDFTSVPFLGQDRFLLQEVVYNFAVPEPNTFALSILAIATLYGLTRRWHRAG